MKQNELKPCKCGAYPVLIKAKIEYSLSTEEFEAYVCLNPDCGKEDAHQKAINAWNTRAKPEADVEGLRSELTHIGHDLSVSTAADIYNDGWNDCLDHLKETGVI